MAQFISIEELNDQLQLKPRFKVEVEDVESFTNAISKKENTSERVSIKRLDEHLWLSIPKAERTYYSPRLHIEIEQKDNIHILHCTFGPDPSLWTLFMFIHFFLGISFLGLLVWLYTNTALEKSNFIVYSLLSLIVLAWTGLYLFARQNRKKAAPQSKQLLEALKNYIS